MATQAMLIADTIAGMRRTITRYHGSSASDSEESIDRPTNRGNKLKRKSQYVHEGQLDRPNGPKVYKRKLEYAGYHRQILSRNPRRYDEDGDELEEDEEDEEADAAAAESNPYSGVILEDLLAPLTSAADLPNHPSLSIPYLSPILTNMTQEACEMVQRERQNIRGSKQLLTKLRGDATWIPGASLDAEFDREIFNTDKVFAECVRMGSSLSNTANEAVGRNDFPPDGGDAGNSIPKKATDLNREIPDESIPWPRKEEAETNSDRLSEPGGTLRTPPSMLDMSERLDREETAATTVLQPHGSPDRHNTTVLQPQLEDMKSDQSTSRESEEGNGYKEPIHAIANINSLPNDATNSNIGQGTANEAVSVRLQEPDQNSPNLNNKAVSEATDRTAMAEPPEPIKEDVLMLDSPRPQDGDEESQPITHRMTTRAQAQAVSDNAASSRTRSASAASSEVPPVHPLFLMPQGAHPDKDFGLPPEEADATRRLLMLYVQKQEEICRSTENLYIGLLKAKRMKKTVLDWCKAEGHVGEMSDGEDWYDKDEWGLEEELRKGHDEEEDEVGTQHKKTRARRA